jgi:hypothetical protein
MHAYAVLWRAGGSIPDSLACLTALTRLDVEHWEFEGGSTFPYACLKTLRHLSIAEECSYEPDARSWWDRAHQHYAESSFQQLTFLDFRCAHLRLTTAFLCCRYHLQAVTRATLRRMSGPGP